MFSAGSSGSENGRTAGGAIDTVNIFCRKPVLARKWIVRYRINMLNHDEVELTRTLERGEAPAGGFPHAAHLRVAWVYLHESPSLDAAVERMAATLRSFAASVGLADKFSMPATVFWMLQIASARAVMPCAQLDEVLSAYPRLLDKNLIRAHDSSHVIASGPTDSSSHTPDRPVPRRPA
jgi:hypothetical protein